MKDFNQINHDLLELYQQASSILSASAGSINGERRKAIERFERLGGVSSSEAYRYLNLAPLFSHDYQVVLQNSQHQVSLDELFKCSVTNLESHPILSYNGKFYQHNEEVDQEEGIVVCSLKEAAIKYPDLFNKYYGKAAIKAKDDAMVALNTSFAQDGMFIFVPDNTVVEKPIQLINLLHADRDLMAFQRNLVIVGKSSKLDLLICDHTLSSCKFLMNSVTEIHIEPNGEVDCVEVQNQHLNSHLINGIYVEQARDSKFSVNMVSLFGGTIRNNIYAALNEPNAEANLFGIYIEDKNQVVDNYTFIDHAAPNCRSHEHFKGVLDDHSIANFTGRIQVRPDAQQTESFQANNNLILKDTARVNAKPQLVIDADDVKCSHGATVGQIDDEAMFYLRSRGIGTEEAKLMLMFGFAHDIIGKIRLEPLRMKIDNLVEKRFRGELSKCHSCSYCGKK